MNKNNPSLTFCTTGGCTAKLGAAVLEKILPMLPKKEDKNLLVGFGSSDDAAVYRLSDNMALVQTLDFFPPMVEDPYTFGQIAAANAMSDIFAMGERYGLDMTEVLKNENMFWELNTSGNYDYYYDYYYFLFHIHKIPLIL